jgi:hypothetical protein
MNEGRQRHQKIVEIIDDDYPITLSQGLIRVALSNDVYTDLIFFRDNGLVWIGLPTRGCDCFAVKSMTDVVAFSEVQEKLHVESQDDAKQLARFITQQCHAAIISVDVIEKRRDEAAQKRIKLENE